MLNKVNLTLLLRATAQFSLFNQFFNQRWEHTRFAAAAMYLASD
jgi:hypothetical protein